jgi:hypothetical protein
MLHLHANFDAHTQMALQAALNKSKAQQPPQGKPLTPRAQYMDGSDAGNSLQRPGTSSLRSAGGGRDGRSLSVRITAPAPALTRPSTGAGNDMRGMASGGSGTGPTFAFSCARNPFCLLPLTLPFCSGGLGSILGNAMNRGPGAQEIVEYARYIGMDAISDVNLLWIAGDQLPSAVCGARQVGVYSRAALLQRRR